MWQSRTTRQVNVLSLINKSLYCARPHPQEPSCTEVRQRVQKDWPPTTKSLSRKRRTRRDISDSTHLAGDVGELLLVQPLGMGRRRRRRHRQPGLEHRGHGSRTRLGAGVVA